MEAKFEQRNWLAPNADAPVELLKLYNSAVDEKVPFVPINGVDSKSISWYTCGPTVYDVSHLGHARNYVTFDIVRRVLEDYFGYSIFYVMNITDVDDKIILRARRNYLFDKFMKEARSTEQLLVVAATAIEEVVAKQKDKTQKASDTAAAAQGGADSRKAKELLTQAEGEQLKLKKLEETRAQVVAWRAEGCTVSVEEAVACIKDAVSEKLDAEQGAGVTDKDIYKAHGAKYEAEFLDDMKRLGVREPDVMTRVTDYMPEIVAFVKGIIDNGLAYEASGSVYFDVKAFKGRGHLYGKLKPWAVGSAELASEGESNFATGEKRSNQAKVDLDASGFNIAAVPGVLSELRKLSVQTCRNLAGEWLPASSTAHVQDLHASASLMFALTC